MSLASVSKIQHPDDVRKALGFNGQPNGLDLKILHDQALHNGSPVYSKSDLRIAWKLASDPYYWRAFNLYQNIRTVEDAGFYDDGLEPGELEKHKDFRNLTTPLENIRQRLKELQREGKIHNKPLVVMLTTGGFAPVHEGHIAMMTAGRSALEKNGYEVLGGFMSPDHDDYVASKGDDARKLSADFRSLLLSKVLEDHKGFDVDPWASRYAPTDLNFTDIVGRMRTYVNAHLKSPVDIKIAYVFGGDNAQFTRAFVGSNDVAVCIARPGETKARELAAQSGLNKKDNIIFTESSQIDKSSSLVRSGKLPPINKLAEDKNWMKWLKGEARKSGESDERPLYLVRDDLSWATEPWAQKINHHVLEKATESFRAGLTRAIENAFERSRAHGYPEQVSVVHLPLDAQIKAAQKIVSMQPERVINNDLITGGEQSAIGISRLFDLSGSQIAGKKIIPRAANADLKETLGILKRGTYTFIDDDIATGTTVKLVADQLPEGVKFDQAIALSEEAFKELYPDQEYSFWDIVDARDFLLGSRNSGLVVQLFNDEVGRAPYMLPYTSLTNRAKIPPDQEKTFSEEILNLNKRFFRDIWADIRLKDTDPQFQNLMKSVGFSNEIHLSDVCSWHQEHVFG